MAGRPIRIGDQLVLEEDYDENYIPSEHARTSQVIFTISILPTGSPRGTTPVMNTIGTW